MTSFSFTFFTGGDINLGSSALFRRYGEKFYEEVIEELAKREMRSIMNPETRIDNPWMKRINGDVRAHKTSTQFIGKKETRQFTLTIAFPWGIPMF